MNRLPQWQFVEDENQQWYWIRTGVDATMLESRQCFRNRADCLLDAVRTVVGERRTRPGRAAPQDVRSLDPPLHLAVRYSTARHRRSR
jgi:hypothetical protein